MVKIKNIFYQKINIKKRFFVPIIVFSFFVFSGVVAAVDCAPKDCLADEWCNNTNGACLPKKDDGINCQLNNECKSELCYQGKCALSAPSGVYSLLKWYKISEEKMYSITGANKFACIGINNDAIDKAFPITGDMGEVGTKLQSGEADVSFIFNDPASLKAVDNGCLGITSYLNNKIIKKQLNDITGQCIQDYPSKDECLKAFLVQIKNDTHNHQACFCASDNGYTNAKCMPNDSKNCQSYLDKDYVKCELKASDECLAGVAKAVQKDVENYDPNRIEIEASAKSSFDYLGTNDVSVIIGRVIKAIMGIMGSIALAMFVYAGILWMTASGNSEKEEKSKTILVWSTLGVIVVFASYALLNFVFEIVK